jgi:hypothetical protein
MFLLKVRHKKRVNRWFFRQKMLIFEGKMQENEAKMRLF